jgi:hypothetical protein
MLDVEAVDRTAWYVLLGAPALAILVILILLVG